MYLYSPKRVEIPLDVQNGTEVSTTSHLDDRGSLIVNARRLLHHRDRGCADSTLTRLVVTTGVHGTGVGEEERVIPATGCTDDVESLQFGYQCRHLVGFDNGLTQLAILIPAKGQRFAVLVVKKGGINKLLVN